MHRPMERTLLQAGLPFSTAFLYSLSYHTYLNDKGQRELSFSAPNCHSHFISLISMHDPSSHFRLCKTAEHLLSPSLKKQDPKNSLEKTLKIESFGFYLLIMGSKVKVGVHIRSTYLA